MKILFLPGYRYPNSLNEPLTCGDLRYSFTLSRTFAKMGHEVTVLTRREGTDPEQSTLDGVKIYRYKSELAKVFGTSFDISANRARLFKKLQKQADLVICNSPLSLEHLQKIDAPIIYVASGLEDVKNYSLKPKEALGFLAIKLLRDPAKKLTWCKSRLVNTTAKFEDATLKKWGVQSSRIGTITSGVDAERFCPANLNSVKILREKLKIGQNDQIILSVSRFTPAKGIIETIRAFEQLKLPDAKLVIVGVQHSHDGSYYQEMLKTIKSSGCKNKIVLKQNVPDKNLPLYYSMADVVSVFSKGYDPLPTTIVEAMACGAPVVSTYYKTREQFIEDGHTGVFVEEKNIQDWVNKVKKLLDDDKLRGAISKNAITKVKKEFDFKKIAQEYLKEVK